LLTFVYKIVAKVFTNRMKPYIQKWILLSQTRFIQNRSILDHNVIMASKVVEWVVESNHNQVIMLLDFEKAYDSLLGYNARYNERTLGFA